MVTKETAHKKIAELVERFEENTHHTRRLTIMRHLYEGTLLSLFSKHFAGYRQPKRFRNPKFTLLPKYHSIVINISFMKIHSE